MPSTGYLVNDQCHGSQSSALESFYIDQPQQTGLDFFYDPDGAGGFVAKYYDTVNHVAYTGAAVVPDFATCELEQDAYDQVSLVFGLVLLIVVSLVVSFARRY